MIVPEDVWKCGVNGRCDRQHAQATGMYARRAAGDGDAYAAGV